MSDLHIYFETGCVGDTGLNLCRAHTAMCAMGHSGVVVHTSPVFRFGNPPRESPSSPVVSEILRRCPFIREVVYDVDYSDATSFSWSRERRCKIHQPMIYRDANDIREYVDLREFIPPYPSESKVALLHPVSLRYKPQDRLYDYIPVWDRCVGLLSEKGFRIVMVGSEDDPIDLTMSKSARGHCDSMVGRWSLLQSLAFLMYRAEFVVACDSWASIWGPAARVQTVCAWGYRMESDTDFWVTNFLGNRDFYKHGWSSQKDYCDALLAAHLGKKIREQKDAKI